MKHAWILSVAILLFWGCQSELTNPSGSVFGTDTAVVNDVSEPASPTDVTEEPEVIVTDDIEPPGANQCLEGEGCFGEPCEASDDCLSGICTLHLGEKVCSKTCDANCPDGWSCQLVSGGADNQYVCVSNFSHLCLPCTDASDCLGDGGAVPCLPRGDDGAFCGGGCSLDTPCPAGYSCQEVENIAGILSFQCVPDSGECECSSIAIAASLTTDCAIENTFGRCEGQRICAPEGLTGCDATVPSEEVCNGIDDDCNGLIDEQVCDDGNACTEDSCAGAAGCEHLPLEVGECLDGDVCTIGDHCEAGVCVGTLIDCEDGDPCTSDTCDGLGGCAYEATNALCDDGDPCTLGDFCQDGLCEGNVTLGCDDGNLCTDDACTPTGCVHTANDAICDDGNVCTLEDTCKESVCAPQDTLSCDDGNVCTNDYCHVTEGCLASPNMVACDDGDVCSVGDTCAGGACLSGGKALSCIDGNPCTDDACDPATGCVFLANAVECDDNNECTIVDTCVDAACVGQGDVPCDDGNFCTQDSCTLQDGCSHTPTEGLCSDGDACTLNDTCQEGACVPGDAMSCDDGNVCTADACDPQAGCIFAFNNVPCDDGNACTTGDTCQGGGCKGLAIQVCDDKNGCTTDSCNPELGCVQSPAAGACDDGNPCTLIDTCANGICSGGDAAVCDDGNPCTADGCDEVVGCVFTPTEGPCDDSDACTEGDSCLNGGCAPGGTLECDDGSFCNGTETCDPATGCLAGTPPVLDDGIGCTVDACDEELDQVVHQADASQCSVDGLCQNPVCNPDVGCEIEIVANCCGNSQTEPGETCDDGNSVGGDGCDPSCQTEVPDSCIGDWLVGTPCNGVNYGNGCSPQDTGYHFKGIIDGYACWWHHKNQAWNTTPQTNFWHLAQHFELTPGQGLCGWCFNKNSAVNLGSLNACSGYFDQGQVGAWGWCAESDPNSAGFVCLPVEGNIACP